MEIRFHATDKLWKSLFGGRKRLEAITQNREEKIILIRAGRDTGHALHYKGAAWD